MKINLLLTYSLFLILLSCDNRQKVIESRNNNTTDSQLTKLEKEYTSALDSLNEEINTLSGKKSQISVSIEFVKANVYDVFKRSQIDHISIGTEDLSKMKSFISDDVGFNVKDGTKHANGIQNFLIEFHDGSEIEFMSIENASDNIAYQYNSLIKNKHYGLQFAVRIDSLKQFYKYISIVDSTFKLFDKNKAYHILAKENYDAMFPLFLIEYITQNINPGVNHNNNSTGLESVWLSTNNIRHSINIFSEKGFVLVDTLTIERIENKTVLLRNNNFEIILIKASNNNLSGLTIRTTNIESVKGLLKNKLSEKVEIRQNKRGKSILLDPKTTNSIWFEFLEPH